MSKYTHFSLEERKLISRLYDQGLSMGEIGERERRHLSHFYLNLYIYV